MCKMPVYYVVSYKEVTPCYLIKEGYIPCQDYRENPDNSYYAYAGRFAFIVASSSYKEVYDSLELAIENAKRYIQKGFQEDIERTIKERDLKLDKLDKLKKDR